MLKTFLPQWRKSLKVSLLEGNPWIAFFFAEGGRFYAYDPIMAFRRTYKLINYFKIDRNNLGVDYASECILYVIH